MERSGHGHGAVEQRHRQRDLDDEQERADPAEAAGRETSSGLQRVAKIVTGHLQRRETGRDDADDKVSKTTNATIRRIGLQRDPERPSLQAIP